MKNSKKVKVVVRKEGVFERINLLRRHGFGLGKEISEDEIELFLLIKKHTHRSKRWFFI
ncbi:MAG: hypothetical protein WCT18_04975 [Patescibacteria group bacterium]